MDPIRVVLVDDHTLFRAGLRSLLAEMVQINVVAEASDGRDAVRLMHSQQPDVVLMDIDMRGLNGIDATKQIVETFPDARILILSMHQNATYVAKALEAGAAGYLLKDAATAELERAISALAQGETYLSPAVAKHVVTGYVERLAEKRGKPLPHEQLTARQREVLQLIAEEYTSKQIADRLHVSLKTVEAYRAQLMKQLHVSNVVGLVRYAIQLGLISVKEE